MPNTVTRSDKDYIFLAIRLFCLAQKKWQMGAKECSAIFEKNDVYGYIKDAWEEFHEQGDDESLLDIEGYLKNRGAL